MRSKSASTLCTQNNNLPICLGARSLTHTGYGSGPLFGMGFILILFDCSAVNLSHFVDIVARCSFYLRPFRYNLFFIFYFFFVMPEWATNKLIFFGFVSAVAADKINNL